MGNGSSRLLLTKSLIKKYERQFHFLLVLGFKEKKMEMICALRDSSVASQSSSDLVFENIDKFGDTDHSSLS